MNSQSWIAFDAAGTLFEPAEPVARVYSRVFSKHGPTVEEAAFNGAFKAAFIHTPDPVYQAVEDGERIEKDWWRAVVSHAAREVEFECRPETMDQIFEQLFSHYAAGNAWKIFDDVRPALESFRAVGTKMAVVSNFDSRLHRVLRETGIADYFELVITSADVGARKPDPRILHRLLADTGAARRDACLVGDSETADGGAARACGIRFFHLLRPAVSMMDFVKCQGVATLPRHGDCDSMDH